MVFRSPKKILVCFLFFSITTHHHHHGLLHVGARSLGVAKQAQTLLLLRLLLKGLVHAWGCSCLLRGEQKEKVLMVGAGGIGCELLKTLVLTGFKHIHLVRFFCCPAAILSLSLSRHCIRQFLLCSSCFFVFTDTTTPLCKPFSVTNPHFFLYVFFNNRFIRNLGRGDMCFWNNRLCNCFFSATKMAFRNKTKQNSVFFLCVSLSPLTLHSLGDLFDEEP